MYEILSEPDKNRIYIKLSGRLSKKEIKEFSSELKQAVMELEEGFDLINDLSEFKIGDPDSESIVKILILFIQNQKPRKVVRIVSSSRIGNAQIARMVNSLNPYQIKYVTTYEEAVALLETK